MDSTKVPRQMEKYDVLMNSHIWSLIHAFPQLACRKDYIFFFLVNFSFQSLFMHLSGAGGNQEINSTF